MKQDIKTAEVKIFRYNPEVDSSPRYETYTVIISEGMSIFNLLRYIEENLAPGLAFYASCRLGLCGGCVVKVNGKNKLACLEPFTDDVVLEPINKERVIKDLLVE